MKKLLVGILTVLTVAALFAATVLPVAAGGTVTTADGGTATLEMDILSLFDQNAFNTNTEDWHDNASADLTVNADGSITVKNNTDAAVRAALFTDGTWLDWNAAWSVNYDFTVVGFAEIGTCGFGHAISHMLSEGAALSHGVTLEANLYLPAGTYSGVVANTGAGTAGEWYVSVWLKAGSEVTLRTIQFVSDVQAPVTTTTTTTTTTATTTTTTTATTTTTTTLPSTTTTESTTTTTMTPTATTTAPADRLPLPNGQTALLHTDMLALFDRAKFDADSSDWHDNAKATVTVNADGSITVKNTSDEPVRVALFTDGTWLDWKKDLSVCYDFEIVAGSAKIGTCGFGHELTEMLMNGIAANSGAALTEGFLPVGVYSGVVANSSESEVGENYVAVVLQAGSAVTVRTVQFVSDVQGTVATTTTTTSTTQASVPAGDGTDATSVLAVMAAAVGICLLCGKTAKANA